MWHRAPNVSTLWKPGGTGWGVHAGGDTLYLWPIHNDVWQQPSQYCKVIIFQLKYLFKRHREAKSFIYKATWLISRGAKIWTQEIGPQHLCSSPLPILLGPEDMRESKKHSWKSGRVLSSTATYRWETCFPSESQFSSQWNGYNK